MRRYGIFVSSGAKIDIGLRLVHPTGIIITAAKIGKSFTAFQFTTVGMKENLGANSADAPEIGDNVTLYANASVIGRVKVADGSVIAAHAVLVNSADEPGVYCGVPAKQIKK